MGYLAWFLLLSLVSWYRLATLHVISTTVPDPNLGVGIIWFCDTVLITDHFYGADEVNKYGLDLVISRDS